LLVVIILIDYPNHKGSMAYTHTHTDTRTIFRVEKIRSTTTAFCVQLHAHLCVWTARY